MADVSVVIPAYNGCHFIQDAIASVMNQTVLPRELIVVDDNSIDNTAEVALRMIENVPFSAGVIRLSQNSGGPARPINVGISATSGKYIAVLDQDDVFCRDKIEHDSDVLNAHPNISVVSAWCGIWNSSEPTTQQRDEIKSHVLACGKVSEKCIEVSSREAIRLLLRFKGALVVGFPGFTFRREHWKEKGGVDEGLRIASDVELLGWLFRYGSLAVRPEIGYFRREHGNNACRRWAEMVFECAKVRSQLVETSSWIDSETKSLVRGEVYGMAYWFRKAGRYKEAVELLSCSHRLGTNAPGYYLSLLKVHLASVAHMVLPRPFVQSAYTHNPVGSELLQ